MTHSEAPAPERPPKPKTVAQRLDADRARKNHRIETLKAERDALRQRYEEAIEALRDLEAELAKEYPNGPWEDGDDPWDRAWVAARTALAHYREATNG